MRGRRSKLTMLAKTFAAKIEIAAKPEGPWIDAKSVVKVMAMKVPKGMHAPFPRQRRQGEEASGSARRPGRPRLRRRRREPEKADASADG